MRVYRDAGVRRSGEGCVRSVTAGRGSLSHSADEVGPFPERQATGRGVVCVLARQLDVVCG